MNASVRERAREIFRADLARTAVDLFIDHGFDGITVEDLSQKLGISRATFFRYFGSKEDVIVVSVEGSGARHAEAIAEARPDDLADPWVLLRAAFEPAAVAAEQEPDRLRARLRMIGALPALKARIVEKRAAQAEEVASALQTRIGNGVDARALVAAAYAVVGLAWDRWADDTDAVLRDILDEVFLTLRSAGRPTDPDPR